MEITREPYFKRGDIILDLKRENPRLILSIKDNINYEFMELKDHNWHDIFGSPMGVSKGDICSQPIDIVEMNYCIYKIE